ncbi:MAG: fused MFS/spermidine synthase [Myxococcota bacterium]
MSRSGRVLLALCFFLSGATSLVLEVAWAKQLTYVLGNSIHATSTVIAAFMGGLGLGSLAAGRPAFARLSPIRTYAGLQLVIGLAGFWSIPILRATTPLFERVYQDLDPGTALFLLVRFLVVFPLMAGPATLMGMSLPLVVEARRRESIEVARNAGLFYGLNTLGAVVGTYAAGFLLIPTLGLERACMATGVVDFVVGVLLFGLARAAGPAREIRAEGARPEVEASDAERPPTRRSPEASARPIGPRRILALVVGASGFLSMVYEVAWFRVLANVLGGTVHAFTSMLGVFLVGVGVGSVLGTAFLPKRGSPNAPVAIGLFAIGAGAMSSLLFVNRLPVWYAELFWLFRGGDSLVGHAAAQAALAAIVVLPTALAMGWLFPLALRAYERLGTGGQDRRDASELYGLNTFGGICGSLACGFVFLPRLGLTSTLVLAAASSALLALVVIAVPMREEARTGRLALAGVGLATMALAGLSIPRLDHLELHRGVFFRIQATRASSQVDALRASDMRLLYYREGLQGSVSVTSGEDLALHISGKPVATTEYHDRVHLALLGHLPALFAESPREVAVIGLGSGVALGALATHPEIESIEVAELEPAVFEVQAYFAAVNGRAVDDPRVRLIAEDGRTHLTFTAKRYDVITSDPISPIIAGAANLYTEDFYRLAAERLRPGGVFCQWWQMSGVSEATFERVLATMQAAFPHLLVFVYGVDSIVLGSREPFAVDWTELERRYAVPAVREDLAFHGFETPIDLLNLIWADAELASVWTDDRSALNTDDNAWLEHQMPIDHYAPRSGPALPLRMAHAIAPSRLAAIDRSVAGLPRAELVEQAVREPPTSSARLHEALLRGVEAWVGASGEAAILPKLPEWHASRRTIAREIGELVELERAFEAAAVTGESLGAESTLRALAARAQHPISYYWSRRLFDWLVERGRDAEALDVLEAMRRRMPGRSILYRLGGGLAERLGDTALGVRFVTEAALFEQEGEDPEAADRAFVAKLRLFWAEQLLARGHPEDAIRHAEAVVADVADEGSPASAHGVLGDALRRLGRAEEAASAYRDAIARRPADADLRVKLAALYVDGQRPDEALALLLDAIEAGSDSSLLHMRAGQLLVGARRDEEAERVFRRALDLDPRSARTHALLGALLVRRGDPVGAADQYAAALEIDPGNETWRDRLRELRRRAAD